FGHGALLLLGAIVLRRPRRLGCSSAGLRTCLGLALFRHRALLFLGTIALRGPCLAGRFCGARIGLSALVGLGACIGLRPFIGLGPCIGLRTLILLRGVARLLGIAARGVLASGCRSRSLPLRFARCPPCILFVREIGRIHMLLRLGAAACVGLGAAL